MLKERSKQREREANSTLVSPVLSPSQSPLLLPYALIQPCGKPCPLTLLGERCGPSACNEKFFSRKPGSASKAAVPGLGSSPSSARYLSVQLHRQTRLMHSHSLKTTETPCSWCSDPWLQTWPGQGQEDTSKSSGAQRPWLEPQLSHFLALWCIFMSVYRSNAECLKGCLCMTHSQISHRGLAFSWLRKRFWSQTASVQILAPLQHVI